MPSTVACEIVTASVATDGVANAVAEATIETGPIAAAASANQRTVFMVGHVLTPFGCVRAERTESGPDRLVTPGGTPRVALLSMTDQAKHHGISYASAGVDMEAGARAVEFFKPRAKKATRPEVRGGLGG